MAINTTTIVGDVFLPSGAVREKSYVIFEMTGFDTDAPDGATVVPYPIRAAISAGGSISQALWPNGDGVRTTFYRVTFEIYNGTSPVMVDGGQIVVPASGGPYVLNDLLPVAPPADADVNDYIAYLAAAVGTATTAASTASAAASSAEASADRVDLGELDAAVDAAATSAASAASSAVAAAAASSSLPNVAAIISDTSTWVEGGVISTREEGFAYEVAASGATDHHLVTAGGTKLYIVADVVMPEMLGAVGFTFTNFASILTAPNETTYLQKALAIGRPVLLTRHYRTTAQLTIAPRQKLMGLGRTLSGIVVGTDFNMAASGVLLFTSPGGSRDGGQQIDGIRLAAYQDVTISARASLITYPPAINIATAADPSFGKLRISGFTTGVVSTTSPNGADFGHLELGTFTVGLDTGPFAHFVRIENLDHWVWDFDPDTDNITAVFLDGTNVAADFGRIDGVQISKMGSFQGEFKFTSAFGTIGQLNCDGSFARLTLLGNCDLSIGAFYSTSAATTDDWAIRLAGTTSRLSIGSAFVFVDQTSSGAGAIQSLGTGCALTIGDLYTRNSGNSRMFYVAAGVVSVSNAYLGVDGANIGGLVNRTIENIYVTGTGLLNLSSTTANTRSAGSAHMLSIDSVTSHRIVDNFWPSWTISLSAAVAQTALLDGNKWGSKFASNRSLTARRMFYYTAVLNASGTATVAHGLGDIRSYRPFAYVVRVGASSERIPREAVNYIDATNISVTDPGGAAASGATVEVYLEVEHI